MTSPRRHIAPYTQQYRFEVTKEFAGFTLIEFYKTRFNFKDENYWRGLIVSGDVSLNRQGTEPEAILKEGDVILTARRDVQEPPANIHYKILYEQDGLLVINKPAPLPVHPCGRFFKNSLTQILKEKFPNTTFHTLHRLDLWTTGVLLLATNKTAAKLVHDQIKKKTIKKVYGVLAKGNFGDKPFVIDVPILRKSGVHRGFDENTTTGKKSITEFTPISKKNGITFLQAVPLTGRTNQIRVHIQVAGGEVLNDPLYSKNPIEENKMDFMGLHCHAMQITGQSGEDLNFVAPWPKGFRKYI